MSLIKNMTWVAGALLVTASGAARAGDHQICYQDQLNSSGYITAIFGCRSDDPNVTCSIDLQGTWVWTPAGSVKKVTLPMSGLYTAHMTFSDGTLRPCSVSALDPSLGAGAPSLGATLVGYTTDASGHAMTAVWTHHSNVNAERVTQLMRVPWDMVAVGGGVVGVESPYGAVVYKSISNWDADKREWLVGTSDLIYAQPHDNDAYVIGLKIEGADQSIRSLVTYQQGAFDPNTWLSMPTGSYTKPAGTIALGGGVFGWDPLGKNQYATASYPNVVQNFCLPSGCEYPYTVLGWTSTSKDHGVSAPGRVTVDLHTIASDLTIGGAPFHVVGSVVAATSGLAAHPSVVVAGAPGEFALTGIGAYVDWQDYGWAGNLIWKLKPRPDIAGVEVASKDHAWSSPATITGYALGIKLVPGPTPTPPKPILKFP